MADSTLITAILAALQTKTNAYWTAQGLPGSPPSVNDTNGFMSALFDTILNRPAANALSVSADYTITDTDHVTDIYVTTGTSTINITLPASGTNAGRTIRVYKDDPGAGGINILANGSDTIARTITASPAALTLGTTSAPADEGCAWELRLDGANWNLWGSISGSNSDGSWVKWADGTMICRGNATTGTGTIVNDNIGTYGWSWYSASATVVFPIMFLSNPTTIVTPIAAISARVTSESTTGAMIAIGTDATAAETVYWMAIGKWK